MRKGISTYKDSRDVLLPMLAGFAMGIFCVGAAVWADRPWLVAVPVLLVLVFAYWLARDRGEEVEDGE